MPRTPRSGLVKGRSQNNFVAQKPTIAHWQSIVTCLNGHLRTMRANYVSEIKFSATAEIYLFSTSFVFFLTNFEPIQNCRCLRCLFLKCSGRYFHLSMFSCLTGKSTTVATVMSLYKTYLLMFFPFNQSCSLLLRRECCSFSNGEYVKTGLAELEQWCHEATEEVIDVSNPLWIFTTVSLLKGAFLLCPSLLVWLGMN